MENIEEIWKPVFNYEGFYEVSNLGNVRSLSRIVNHSHKNQVRKIIGRVLKQSLNQQQYFKVRLSKNGIKKSHQIHHLVAESFLNHTKRSNFLCVDHIDEDTKNNKLSNLQILTKKENTKKSYDYKKQLKNK